MLSCSIPDVDDADWFFSTPIDFIRLETGRRKRCRSCNVLIELGACCIKFERFRYPVTDIEEKIYGEDGEIELGTYYHCEKCGEQYFNLDALGFCLDPEDNMLDCLKEYKSDYLGK